VRLGVYTHKYTKREREEKKEKEKKTFIVSSGSLDGSLLPRERERELNVSLYGSLLQVKRERDQRVYSIIVHFLGLFYR